MPEAIQIRDLDDDVYVAHHRARRGRTRGSRTWRQKHDRHLKRERRENRAALTHGGVIGQVWRGGHSRQATLARLLPGIDVRPVDDDLGRHASMLLSEAGGEDVMDAAVVLLAHGGDEIFTSDPVDLRTLAQVAGRQVELIRT